MSFTGYVGFKQTNFRLDSFLGHTWATTFPTIYKLKYGLINFILISPHITVQDTIKVGSNVYIQCLLNRIEPVCSRWKSFKNCTPIAKLDNGSRLKDMFTRVVLQCSNKQTSGQPGLFCRRYFGSNFRTILQLKYGFINFNLIAPQITVQDTRKQD